MDGNFTRIPVEWVKQLLAHTGASPATLEKLDTPVTLLFTVLLAFAIAEIIYRITQLVCRRLMRHKEYKFLSKLLKYGALRKQAYIIPPIVINTFLPIVLGGRETALRYIEGFVWIYFIVVLVIAVNALLNSISEQAFTNSKYHDRPIKGFIQITKFVIYIIATIIAVSILTNKSPLYLIGGLGAFAAVLLLITKDSIMGFVGGYLLLENDMVRLGDWIEMTGTNINGTVVDISLTIVKVQNFDNTIVTIPPYSLINNSFTNWRGMDESGGRRIARGFTVKVDNIKPCDKEFFERVKGVSALLDEYIARKQQQSRDGVTANTNNPEGLVNGTVDTNLGVFRAYAEMYLRHHPLVHKEMLIMVRTLTPTEAGLPVQFYCFTTITEWNSYESIQSEIMEHFASVMPRFGLYPFQTAGSRDAIISGLLEGNFPLERIDGLPTCTTK